MSFENEKEILELIAAFEDTSIARGDWKHSHHLVVALWYIEHHGLDDATVKMRDGLFRLLTEGFKVDLSKEMPYHETLTVFWMRTVADFAATSNGMPLHEKANRLIEEFDKDYPLRFYSREFLFSDEARSKYLEPNLRQYS